MADTTDVRRETSALNEVFLVNVEMLKVENGVESLLRWFTVVEKVGVVVEKAAVDIFFLFVSVCF